MQGRNYTRQDIQDWKNSLQSIPKEITEKKQLVGETDAELTKQKQLLAELEAHKISPAEQNLERLIAKIDLITIPEKIKRQAAKLPPLDAQIAALNNPIRELESDIKLVKGEINRIEKLISIKNTQTNIEKNETQLSAAIHSKKMLDSELVLARSVLASKVSVCSDVNHDLHEIKAKRDRVSSELESLYRTRSLHLTTSSVNGGFSSSASDGYSSSASQNPGGYESSQQQQYHDPVLDAKILSYEQQRNTLIEQISYRTNDLRKANRERDESQATVHSLERTISQSTSDICQAEKTREELHYKFKQFPLEEKSQAQATPLSQLEHELADKNRKLDSLKSKLRSRQQEQAALVQEYTSIDSTISRLEHRQEECAGIVEGYTLTDDLKQLENLKTEQQTECKKLADEKAHLTNEISRLKKIIQQADTDINSLTRKLSEKRGNEYLNLLENNPANLLDRLMFVFNQHIQRFELEHAYQQSLNVKKCLAELQYKTAFILQYEKEHIRQRYYLMCGLFASISSYWYEDSFVNMIRDILIQDLIDLSEAKNDYIAFQQQHPAELSSLPDNIFQEREEAEFIAARNSFKEKIEKINASALPQLKKVKNLGSELLSDIDKKRTTAFDAKYYTSVLNIASQLLTQPAETQLHQTFRSLVNHYPNDKPSIGYKIGGVALMFLGAVISASAAVVAILGFPIGAPLYFSMPVLAVGVGMILTGIGLFCHGARKSMPEKLAALDIQMDKHSSALLTTEGESSTLLGPGSYTPSAPGLNL